MLSESEQSATSVSSRLDALLDLKRYQEAEQLVRQQLATAPDDAWLLCQLARTQYAQEQYVEAETTLHAAISQAPDAAVNYYLLSLVSHQRRHFTQELDYARKAVELEPEQVDYLEGLVYAYLQNGQAQQAREVQQQVVKLAPDSESAFALLGRIEWDLNNYADAEAAYQKALAFNPEDISLLAGYAGSLSGQKKKLRQAIDVYYNIIQLDPTNADAAKALYQAIQAWVDNNSFKGQGGKALAELPESLQHFYRDYQKRSSIFVAWGRFTWIIVWLGAFIGLIALFSFFVE